VFKRFTKSLFAKSEITGFVAHGLNTIIKDTFTAEFALRIGHILKKARLVNINKNIELRPVWIRVILAKQLRLNEYK
jgi:hypothetical protein